jgi:hypothetical protein
VPVRRCRPFFPAGPARDSGHRFVEVVGERSPPKRVQRIVSLPSMAAGVEHRTVVARLTEELRRITGQNLETLIDGGIADPLPVDVLQEMGIEKIIAVNVIPRRCSAAKASPPNRSKRPTTFAGFRSRQRPTSPRPRASPIRCAPSCCNPTSACFPAASPRSRAHCCAGGARIW